MSTLLRYGVISGLIIVGLSSLHWLFLHDMEQMMTYGMIISYASMILALSMVYVGVRRYRDTVLGGTITFWRAMGCGALIALAAHATAEQLATAKAEMADFVEMYADPVIRMGFTFMEILPVGLLATIIAAAVLRRRTQTTANHEQVT